MASDSKILLISGNHLNAVNQQIGTDLNKLQVPGQTQNSSATSLKSNTNINAQYFLSTAHGLPSDTATIVVVDKEGKVIKAELGEVKRDEKTDLAVIKSLGKGRLEADSFKLALNPPKDSKVTVQNPLTGRRNWNDIKAEVLSKGKKLEVSNPGDQMDHGASGSGMTQEVDGEQKVVAVTQTKEVSGGTIQAANLSDPFYKKSLDGLLQKFGQNINAFA